MWEELSKSELNQVGGKRERVCVLQEKSPFMGDQDEVDK
jgi:hypothetical protein